MEILTIFYILPFFIISNQVTANLNCSEWSLHQRDEKKPILSKGAWHSRLQKCFDKNNYDTRQYPVTEDDVTPKFQINFTLHLLEISDLEADGSLIAVIRAVILWTDQFRSWDYEEIPLNETQVLAGDIWHPIFNLENCENDRCLMKPDNDTHITIDNQGKAIMVFTKMLNSRCEMDIGYFPFDDAYCELQFIYERLSYKEEQYVVINEADYEIENKDVNSDEWHVKKCWDDVKNFNFIIGEETPQGSFKRSESHMNIEIPGFVLRIELKRYPIYYVYNIIAPTLIISATGVFTVMIPPGSEKVNMAVTVLLGFFFVQTITGDLLPRSQDTQFLARYTLSALILSTLNLLFCLIIVATFEISPKKKPGPILAKILNFLSWAMFHRLNIDLSGRDKKQDAENGKESQTISENIQVKEEASKEKKNQDEEPENYWEAVAVVLNRFFSLAYVIGATGVALAFFLPIFL